MIVLPNFLVFNDSKNFVSWEIFEDSVKLAWNSTFVDDLGPRDLVKIKPKSNTVIAIVTCNSNSIAISTVKPVLSSHSKIDKTKVLKTDYHLMQVKSIAECF